MIEKRKTPENFGIKREKIPEELTDEDREKYGKRGLKYDEMSGRS